MFSTITIFALGTNTDLSLSSKTTPGILLFRETIHIGKSFAIYIQMAQNKSIISDYKSPLNLIK